MLTEVLIGFALGAVPMGAALFFSSREWAKEREALLDRLMAKLDLPRVSPPPSRPVRQAITDEDEYEVERERAAA